MGKLVYLDSAQFDWLERASPEATREFVDAWTQADAGLALSLHHLQEMGQLQDSSSLQRRLNVLKLFPVICCLPASSDDVVRREARTLLLQKLGYSDESARPLHRDHLFPDCPLNEVIATTLPFQPLFHLYGDALSQGALAENLSKQARPKKPLKVPADFDWDLAAETWPSVIDEVFAHLPEVTPEVRAAFSAMFARVKQHRSARSMLVDAYGLGEVEILKRIPDDDLVSAYVFYSAAREEAKKLAIESGEAPGHFDGVVNAINMYDAPGFSLKVAIRRGRRPHPKEAEPGDQTDEDHISFTPYVDLLLADKRTVSYLRQEATRLPNLLHKSLVDRVRRVADVKGVILEISRLGSASQ